MKKIILAILAVLLLSTTALAADFPDVPRDGSEKANAIYKLADAGIVGGYEDGNFRPDRHLTRAELCKIVNLIFNYNLPDAENFKDVKNTDWFYGYVLVAKKAGYIKGFEDNTFRGNTNLTREQTCIIISRTAGLYDIPTSAVITDKVSDWAVADVKKVIANYVMPLPSDGKFPTTENITRGELAMALSRFVKASSTPSTPSAPSGPSSPSVPSIPSIPSTNTTYTVKFYDGDGKVISTQTVKKGDSAAVPLNPSKTDKEYTYTFKGWDKAYTNVQSNLDIHPLFDTERIKYTIKLNYGTGTTGTMPASITVYYSTDIGKVLPTEGFSNGTLFFAGWYEGDNLIDEEKFYDLSGDTLTAKWVTTFTVNFYDGYGKIIKTQNVKNGGKATAPTSPKKDTDEEFSYKFEKWDKSFSNVQQNLDVYPVYEKTPIIYTITLNYGTGASGTLTQKVEVTFHQLLSEVLPTTGFKRDGYVFEGWYYNGNAVNGKKYSDIKATALTAVWTKLYTVRFYNDENGSVIFTQIVKKGESATAPSNPSKAEDNVYKYTFKGWDKSFSSVSSDLDIYPVYTKTEKTYSVTLDYGTGKTEKLILTYYQELSSLLPTNVTNGSKLFGGWYVGDELVDSERYCDLKGSTIVAKWTDVFTVQFYDDENGNVISTQKVNKGGNATAPSNPSKAEDDVYRYTFKSWDKTFTNVQQNLDVYPVYTKTEKTYSVTLDYGNGTTKKVSYKFNDKLADKIPTSITNGNKTLIGWYAGSTEIGDQTYGDLRPEAITAKWASALTVTFYDASGNKLKSQEVKIGGKATAPSSPKKSSTNEYTYSFIGWDSNNDGEKDELYKNVQTNLEVYPLYEESIRYYTLSLNYGENTEGTMPQSVEVTYSETVADVLPTTGFTNHPFLFDGWYSGNDLIEDQSYSELSSKSLTAKWKADPEILLQNKTVIEEMEGVLYDIDNPLADGFTKKQKKVLKPVQEAILLAIADAKAGYIVNKQYILDNYTTQIKTASDLYHGRDEEGEGFQTDDEREDFYFAVGNNLPAYTVKYLIEFFDVNINEHL